MTVFFLNATSFGNTIGDLWEFCGFLQTRFYNNAAKIFSAIIKIWTLYQYINICLKEAQEWREICCLEGFWKEVERYTIIKISVLVPLAKL